ncbi:hypothetical protein LEP1GSC043_2416 [Leptospira weilii str. Ecochallenge]|uniref:Uncharacterized protein n=1 Tax=Leptospira weilii str. Ecochallenge TaxID=1049986 RepID=N1U7N2_9LEPT|nr:hypothetical protein LEP1GSC043_2416 [Leptospira weilii str. Ecochallenge]
MKFENPNSFLQNQTGLFLMVFEFGLRFTSKFKQILFLLIPTQWSSVSLFKFRIVHKNFIKIECEINNGVVEKFNCGTNKTASIVYFSEIKQMEN